MSDLYVRRGSGRSDNTKTTLRVTRSSHNLSFILLQRPTLEVVAYHVVPCVFPGIIARITKCATGSKIGIHIPTSRDAISSKHLMSSSCHRPHRSRCFLCSVRDDPLEPPYRRASCRPAVARIDRHQLPSSRVWIDSSCHLYRGAQAMPKFDHAACRDLERGR